LLEAWAEKRKNERKWSRWTPVGSLVWAMEKEAKAWGRNAQWERKMLPSSSASSLTVEGLVAASVP
jgi:hypothetical protein